jgi:hypothetical protein
MHGPWCSARFRPDRAQSFRYRRSRLVLAVLELSLFVRCQRLVKRLRDLLSEAIRCPQCEQPKAAISPKRGRVLAADQSGDCFTEGVLSEISIAFINLEQRDLNGRRDYRVP